MKPKPVDEYWSSFFGLTSDQMEISDVLVMAHKGLGDYNGGWVFRHKALTIISVPADLQQAVSEGLEGYQGDVLDENLFPFLLGSRVERVIGPAYHGYVDSLMFRPAPTLGARRLRTQDADALKQLCESCSDIEWEHSGVVLPDFNAIGAPPTFGCFVEDALVAVSQYWPENSQPMMATAGILTHPAYRGQGFGKVATSARVEECLKHGYTMLYQTLFSNASSIGIANSLGYEQYAVHFAARFT